MMNLVGERFGRLTVVERGEIKNHKQQWKCVCDCGLTVLVYTGNLRSGNTLSCGCLRREKAAAQGKANATHGKSHAHRTRLYSIWCGMRQRCNNPNRDYYSHYGGKGVKICDEWSDFPTFEEWATTHGYADDLSIDRIDNNGNYCPDNCRWITRSENTARANKNHTTRKVIRGEGLPKVSQPQRIDGEKI